MRLDRYLSQVTPLSRSQARKAIRAGRVLVEGRLAREPALDVPLSARLELDGRGLGRPGYRYFMLNKPAGCVCATWDPQHRTVIDLLHEPVTAGLHPVGRLDLDTTGLVLLSDDGAWSHRITSPRRHTPKTYRVGLALPLSEPQAQRLCRGVVLRHEPHPTRPARLERLGEREIRLTLTEGRYHQVKRMLAALGNRVTTLHREAVAGLALDAGLAPGQYRPLTAGEILRAVAGPAAGRSPPTIAD